MVDDWSSVWCSQVLRLFGDMDVGKRRLYGIRMCEARVLWMELRTDCWIVMGSSSDCRFLQVDVR